MVSIKFPKKIQDEALGFLVTNFCGQVFRSGEVIVPKEAR